MCCNFATKLSFEIVIYSFKPSIMLIFKNIIRFLSCISIFLILTSCGGLKKPNLCGPALEPDGRKRARQNVLEGRGFNFGGNKNQGGDFLFASSNPLWRASLETIDFMSLSTVDYAGGLIITDWYSEENSNEAIKITIKFLSNEIRADGIKIDFHKRTCATNNNCFVKKIDTDLDFEIKDKILKKAAVYDIELKKRKKANQPKKVFKGDNE